MSEPVEFILPREHFPVGGDPEICAMCSFTNAPGHVVQMRCAIEHPDAYRGIGSVAVIFGRPVVYVDEDKWACLQLLVLAGHAEHFTI